MVTVSIREFSHNLSSYLKKVKKGERIVVTERNVPIADITAHNSNVTKVGWKRKVKRLKIKGASLSETVIQMRREQRY